MSDKKKITKKEFLKKLFRDKQYKININYRLLDWRAKSYSKKAINEKLVSYSYSHSKKMIKEGKINEEFVALLSNLTLEELIGLKIESAAKSFNGKMYGLPLWKSLIYVTRDALLRTAFTVARTRIDAARFLGLTVKQMNNYIMKYRMYEPLEVKYINLKINLEKYKEIDPFVIRAREKYEQKVQSNAEKRRNRN